MESYNWFLYIIFGFFGVRFIGTVGELICPEDIFPDAGKNLPGRILRPNVIVPFEFKISALISYIYKKYGRKILGPEDSSLGVTSVARNRTFWMLCDPLAGQMTISVAILAGKNGFRKQ
jgi:hypothetical protein